MASIFKKKKRERNAVYWIQYTDHLGIRRTKKGFTDKGLTEQLAARLENEAMLRKTGMIDTEREAALARQLTKLSEHLRDFEKHIRTVDGTAKHVKLTLSRIRKILAEAGFVTAVDIDAESLEMVLGEMLESGEIGNRTYNHYLQAMDQFCRWMVPKRLATNPLAGMKRLNTEVDIRHPRRALTVDEFQRLLESARKSGVSIQCYDGEQRARIYFASYMTGLRRKELAQLTPRSFNLTSDPPTLTVEAACSKHRRKDVLPMHPQLVKEVQQWIVGMGSNELLFPHLGKRRTWLMVKKDLERIGIPYENEDGIADFHAAGRHTHITQLLRSGASITEARELARHTDVRMTMKYTHIGIADQARALAGLPSPQVEAGEEGAAYALHFARRRLS